ncbi:MAG: primosomal protein N' [Granulosicoccaceae bacterium]|jgi:primosomal protein N' (replication factor Y)
MSTSSVILRVAVPSPLRSLFDYLPARQQPGVCYTPGMRVRVPFGRQQKIGLVVAVCDHSAIDSKRLKPVSEVLDEAAILPAELMALLEWASTYYHHAPGDVMQTALPLLLRQGHDAHARGGQLAWRAIANAAAPDMLARAPKQAAVYALLQQHPDGLDAEQLKQHFEHWRDAIRALQERGLVETLQRPCLPRETGAGTEPAHEPTPCQRKAVAAITPLLDDFHCVLLDGVTGSGKTEVYLSLIAQVLERGGQALVLVPEINLTPQTVARFRRRFQVPVAALHSGLSDAQRLCAWQMARDGEAGIIIGTRSAVFTPLARPAIIIIDEEHDGSFKQQDGFRYHARDLAVRRAQQCRIPVILGSATPSLESLDNARQGRYSHVTLSERAGGGKLPPIALIDCRKQPLQQGLSKSLLDNMRDHLARGEQVLLFLNRRGYAPTLMCYDCGWTAHCARCDAQLIVHHRPERLRCHHCDHTEALPTQCPACASDKLRPLGQGTERIEAALAELFPGKRVLRIDRDSTRRKGAMHAMLEQIHRGEADILLGTQMLAKGHDFPGVTLVGVLNADQGLFSIDHRASERMAQLIIQVAGRAGRAMQPGRVLVQTWHPDHPLLQTLITRGYPAFAEQALAERREAALPPYSRLALLRAEATAAQAPQAFLSEAATIAPTLDGVMLLGPVPAPLERRGGRYRAQLLVQADSRASLHKLLNNWLPLIEGLKLARQVRWSVDVDPVDMF